MGTPEKKCRASLDRQVQNFVNVLAAIAHFQDLRLVARAFALFADQFDIGEKLHLHGDRAVALAGFAASAGDIEGKVPGAEAALFGFGQGGKEVTDSVEGLDVGDRIGTRGAADRRLVDQDDVVDQVVAFEFFPVGGRREALPLVCRLAADKA